MPSLDEYAKAGIEAINKQKYDVALESFSKALELAPDRPDINNALGMAYFHVGQVHEAIPHLERSVALAEPFEHDEHQDMKRHFQLGLASAYQLADRVPDALAQLRATVARWPEAPEPRISLAQLLLEACGVDEGLTQYRELAQSPALDEEQRKAADAVAGAISAFLQADHPPSVFLEAHAASYKEYFDDVVSNQAPAGWYAEAARMSKEFGEMKPVLAEGARPYAMTRVDLVNPNDGNVSDVYAATDPMVVAVKGLEPLAQVPVLFAWAGHPFEVWVCTRCPWHWLTITIQLQTAEDVVDTVDEIIGEWYLSGYNGDFGDADSGRFHYVTDPEPLGDRGVSYTFDLGRARFEAIEALLRKLTLLHDRRPIQRVLFGQGRLPD